MAAYTFGLSYPNFIKQSVELGPHICVILDNGCLYIEIALLSDRLEKRIDPAPESLCKAPFELSDSIYCVFTSLEYIVLFCYLTFYSDGV